MDIFDFLNGASPWWWIAAGIGLGIVEMLTFSFFLIGPGIAAVVVGVVLWMAPGMSGAIQMLIFAALSIGLTLAARGYVLNRKPDSEVPGLNDRAAQMVGRMAVVVDGFAAGGTGNVEVDGVRWRAQLSEGAGAPAPGDVLRITDTRGMTLVVST